MIRLPCASADRRCASHGPSVIFCTRCSAARSSSSRDVPFRTSSSRCLIGIAPDVAHCDGDPPRPCDGRASRALLPMLLRQWRDRQADQLARCSTASARSDLDRLLDLLDRRRSNGWIVSMRGSGRVDRREILAAASAYRSSQSRLDRAAPARREPCARSWKCSCRRLDRLVHPLIRVRNESSITVLVLLREGVNPRRRSAPHRLTRTMLLGASSKTWIGR